MNYAKQIKWYSVILLILTVYYNRGEGADEQPKQKTVKSIHVNDLLMENVKIVGDLNKPLGDLITIQGTWRKPEGEVKDDSLRFHIDHVDGKELKEPIILRSFKIRPIFSDGPKGEGRKAKNGEPFDWKFQWFGKVPAPQKAEGDKWELVGVEMLNWRNLSEEAVDLIGTFPQDPRPSVYTEFQFITLKKLK